MIRKLAIGLVAASAAAAVILPGPVADMLGVGEPLMMRASGLVLFAFGFLALAALPEFITAIMFFLAAMVLQVSTPAVIFSGFASTAWWLVFGGLVAGIAIDVTGLGRRLARAASGRLTHSYGGAVNGVVLVAVILAFLMPSTMGRVVLLMPIVLALADRLGLVAGRPGRTGLVMAATLGTYVPSTAILPANVPNTVLLGAADALYGIKLNYGPYLLQHFPIMGLAYVLILVPVILRLFPDRLDPAPPESSATPISGDERKLAIILGASLAAFSLDFVHGISPAWVSLAAGLACLLPGIGLVSPKMFAERMNLGVLLYVAGIIGVGALISDSGIGVRLGAALVDLARPVPGE
ncbi:MAG: SLC13 family permease, partial [Alphaproteobacteria bacterium]|nr:SLC13 family permease [Alphaproteobacteria bacterium]